MVVPRVKTSMLLVWREGSVLMRAGVTDRDAVIWDILLLLGRPLPNLFYLFIVLVKCMPLLPTQPLVWKKTLFLQALCPAASWDNRLGRLASVPSRTSSWMQSLNAGSLLGLLSLC